MKYSLAIFLLILTACSSTTKNSSDAHLLTFTGANQDTLGFQLVNERAFRFEYTAHGQEPAASSVMIERKNWSVPPSLKALNDGFETSAIHVAVETQSLCFTVKSQQDVLAKVCPGDKQLSVAAPQITHVFGLGEQFTKDAGETNQTFNWLGQVRTPGDEFGNKMVGYDGGATGNAQFPIAYALSKTHADFALIVDNHYAQTWDLHQSQWNVKVSGGPERGYFLAASQISTLRQDYMDLVGHAPVLPKKAFGLWVSEFGYDNWAELDGKLKTLRENHFPLDGFVLDLQWFGGIKEKSEASAMGGLQWDEARFPNHLQKIHNLKEQGVGLVSIEEPYISRGVVDQKTGEKVYDTLAKKGFLANDADGNPVRLDAVATWWGLGSMLDFVQDDAADFWHDWKRQPIIDSGIIGHWTDLGEPEMFLPNATYDRGHFHHRDIHNIYNLKWTMSVVRGYERHGVLQRPWILSRSGTMGTQRYGVSMWSGDIGSNFVSLRAHLRAQLHMSLSGVDYFGSDTGGFHREAMKGDMKDLYTQWFADSALFDIPVRPHTENLCNCKETAPDRVGDRASNLANLRLRYQLFPYYYDLAHEAFNVGAPVVAPLAYYFQEDLKARDIADEKMIGPSLLAVAAAVPKMQKRDVYLPAGDWFDYRTGHPIHSAGQWLRGVSVRHQGKLELPLYARAGSIIPAVDLSDEGKPGTTRILRVFPSAKGALTTVFDDDGVTQKYRTGAESRTPIAQTARGGNYQLTISPEQGAFTGAPSRRDYWVQFVVKGKVRSVTLNGKSLAHGAKLAKSSEGWTQQDGVVHIQLAQTPVVDPKTIELSFR